MDEHRLVSAELVQSTQTFVLDCDGVIWRGNKLIDGVSEVLEYMREQRKRLVFLTNNSTKTRQQQVDKFHRLGLTWVRPEDVLTSAFAAAALVEQQLRLPKHKKVYVVGHGGIVDELQRCGYTCVGADEHAGQATDLSKGVQVDPDIGAVVVGFDLHFNYFKMVYATQCILTLPNCAFVATNQDALSHVVSDAEWPGGGTMVAALQHAVGRPPIVAGKPSDFLVNLLHTHYAPSAKEGLGATGSADDKTLTDSTQAGKRATPTTTATATETAAETGVGTDTGPSGTSNTANADATGTKSATAMCMVGDRLDTDIAFGEQAGMRTLLVFSGVTAKERLAQELQRLQAPSPDFVADSLASLLQFATS